MRGVQLPEPFDASRNGVSPRAQGRLELDGPAEQNHVSGVIERVTFHNEDTGFSVLRVRLPRRRELATVVGKAARVSPGEFIEAEGEWSHDARHGQQFSASELRVAAPTSRQGMERYLGSGLVHGIGPGLAKRLVESFGEQVFDVIEGSPERLREVQGVGSVRSERIVAAWAEQKRVREIMVFLYSHGVGTARAVRIYRSYGEAALERIREDPYCLARDIRGIGFLTADALARQLGVEPNALERVRAGVSHVLREAVSDGHCGLPEAELHRQARELLDVDAERVESALAAELRAGEIVRDDIDQQPCVFLSGLYGAERSAAARLLALARGAPPWGEIDAAPAIAQVEEKLAIELAQSQRAALTRALRSKVVVMTGGPGVGKTTLVKSLLAVLRGKKVRTALAAPTGRAAKRLAEATGQEARTLHRLLEADPRSGGFKRDESNPIDCALLVVDESSMVDVPLLFALLKAVPPTAALVLVGDVDQLPSVGPGQVLRDIIDSGAVPVVRLREIFRQAATSRIVRSAHRVNEGQLPDLAAEEGSDFYFIETAEPDDAAQRILTLVRERIPKRFGFDPMREVQVLCPMHRGQLGARALNLALQETLNPSAKTGARVERFGWTYALGDKVMQIENDYDKKVFNGDVGFVEAVDPEQGELVVDFDERSVPYGFDELDQLVLAYAITVHKSQGSEYPAVVIPITTQHYTMLKRNLIYTALTRGKQLVVLIGQRRALAMAVQGKGQELRRWSKLRSWLAEEGRQGRSGSEC
ncbi:MAG: ATP-dependent RecD-like DNA helicase [Deltaproteobacteria bacterium]|nr:ATP-dependent RecD-like DNA helicase [Deltaproteobacteria bacterium]MBW2417451.1 ATP-dependent RecD-like DNA helicase [Deltaproteobacteria bacterium]